MTDTPARGSAAAGAWMEEMTMAEEFPNLDVKTRVFLVGEDAEHPLTMGRGVAELLRGVRDRGSLNQAAKDLNMAYSKAWTLMRSIEEAFGVPLLARDGAHGSSLTDEGEKLLALYEALEHDVAAYAQSRLEGMLGGSDV